MKVLYFKNYSGDDFYLCIVDIELSKEEIRTIVIKSIGDDYIKETDEICGDYYIIDFANQRLASEILPTKKDYNFYPIDIKNLLELFDSYKNFKYEIASLSSSKISIITGIGYFNIEFIDKNNKQEYNTILVNKENYSNETLIAVYPTKDYKKILEVFIPDYYYSEDIYH